MNLLATNIHDFRVGMLQQVLFPEGSTTRTITNKMKWKSQIENLQVSRNTTYYNILRQFPNKQLS